MLLREFSCELSGTEIPHTDRAVRVGGPKSMASVWVGRCLERHHFMNLVEYFVSEEEPHVKQ